MSSIFAVDIGGTFTDLAAYDLATRTFRYTKALTSYGDFFRAIDECAKNADLAFSDALLFKHGTTLVINALLQRRGGKTALVTTRGFRDVLEIGRGNRPEVFNLAYRRDPPLVPRDLRYEVSGRIDGQGRELAPLDAAELGALAATLAGQGVEAVAVSFINAYCNPQQERQAAALLREALPGVFVTCATDLSREWYEFERTATVAANAFVGPETGTYVSGLKEALRERRFAGNFYLMSSGGGILTSEHVERAPVELVESGPVGGLIGAGVYSRALGLPRVVAFDMGGTTAKCAVLTDGTFDVESVYYVGGYGRGFPIRSNVVDIVEVGAGGGSIAWLDEEQRLRVGPKSAGSKPGPVCFQLGGTEPTVTDANVILGRIDPGAMLGGELSLSKSAAAEALHARIGTHTGYAGEDGTLRLAAGVLAIANVTMANAVKRVTIERGQDPRDFVMMAYGGGGPLHAADLARDLHIGMVVIPPNPGNFSAFGMLMASIERTEVETFLRTLGPAAMADLQAAYMRIETHLGELLQREFGAAAGGFQRRAEMRYKGQMHTLRIAVAPGADAAAMRAEFDRAYGARYGHADAISPVEIVGVRVTAGAEVLRPELAQPQAAAAKVSPGRRTVYFAGPGLLETAIYQRADLAPGFGGAGPALIEEYGSTCMVGPEDSFVVGGLGELRIRVAAA